MSLTDVTARNAKAKGKPYKLADGQGLYLYVSAVGSRFWRFDYRFEGKRKTLSIGPYPEVALADARTKLAAARKLLANGVDPAGHKRQIQNQRERELRNTFGVVANEYIARLGKLGRADATLQKNIWMKSLVSARVQALPLTDISSADILEVLQDIEATGRRETAHAVRTFVGSVFR